MFHSYNYSISEDSDEEEVHILPSEYAVSLCVSIGGNKFCDIIIASTICLTMNVSSSVPLLRACMIQHTFFGAIKFTLGSRVNL